MFDWVLNAPLVIMIAVNPQLRKKPCSKQEKRH